MVGELEHALVHRGTRGTVEIGSAAGVDVLVAPARALELLLDRLDRGVVVTGGLGGGGAPRPGRGPPPPPKGRGPGGGRGLGRSGGGGRGGRAHPRASGRA